MTTSNLDAALKMAREGKTIAFIHKELGMDYWEVWQHVRDEEGTDWSGWNGAKWIVTHRLNRLVKERDEAKRKILRDEADEAVRYLYAAAKRLSRRIDRARSELSG